MEPNAENISDLISGLKIDDISPLPASLHKTIRASQQSIDAVGLQLQATQSTTDAGHLDGLSVAEICSLHNMTEALMESMVKLRDRVGSLNGAVERSIVMHVTSLGMQCRGATTVSKLLLHFDGEMRDIVREVLNGTGTRNLLLRVAEACHTEAIHPGGKLDALRYFAPLEEAALGCPFDEDLEAEEYHEHEERLEMDECYARRFQKQVESRSEAAWVERHCWPGFWVEVLNHVPAGPTLFYPPASSYAQSTDFGEVPRYLFRTFDEASSGRNTEEVIRSTASQIGSPKSSRIDVLSTEPVLAAKLIVKHLQKPCFLSGMASDNFMSWTSSLLFAIQYALWRLAKHRANKCSYTQTDIKICMVDSRDFPEGQFAQDVSLFKTYYETAEQLQDKSVKSFFDFRLDKVDYYNGEFVSQGAVNIAGRSCVVSLEDLIQGGLFKLYPRFEEAKGGKDWTNRVRELRQCWSVEQKTSDGEIDVVLGLARKCCPKFDPLEIACILLAFKKRKYSRPVDSNRLDKLQPTWADRPAEVRRGRVASEAAKASTKLPSHEEAWLH